MRLVFEDVTLALPEFVLRASFDVETNALGIFGPSGAGKTTLLEIIAGLRAPDRGRIFIDDVEITSLKARERRIGYVPQDDTLFPHLSVRGNVMYGGTGGAPILHWIDDLMHRSVTKLSGGERRRVALARAMVTNPRLLLLDELLGGLDDAKRRELIALIPRPIIFVSHERDEIAALCEHVVSIDRGQCSPPASLPQSSFSLSSRPQLKR
jgi:molybdate transport system ATP-binding protein